MAVSQHGDGTQISAAGSVYIHQYFPTSYIPSQRQIGKSKERTQIYLCSLSTEPNDQYIANLLVETLRSIGIVSTSDSIELNTQVDAITNCDFFIVLLSNESVHSEQVIREVGIAARRHHEKQGQPNLLPIRVAFSSPLQYPLSAYLNQLGFTVWNSEIDNGTLVEDVVLGIESGILPRTLSEELIQDDGASASIYSVIRPHPFASPDWLERPDGTMPPDSPFYIERHSDQICLSALGRGIQTIGIKASRQMGKSSLLVRVADALRQQGTLVAFLDFQLLDQDSLHSSKTFFKNLCHWISAELHLRDYVESYWEEKAYLGDLQICTGYFLQHILASVERPILLAIDEADRLVSSPFRSGFFGMLRSWHNMRLPGSKWKLVTLFLVISTEPYALVANQDQSPFNVGEIVRLKDFLPEQVAELNRRYGNPFSESQIGELVKLLGGHPFLTRLSMYRVASGDYQSQRILDVDACTQGPFYDHLRHMQTLLGDPILAHSFHQIINDETHVDDNAITRLEQAGLIKQRNGRHVVRCELYRNHFRSRIN